MRFVLTEKNIELNKRFVTLLENAKRLYNKQDCVYFLNNELILFYNFEPSLNGNKTLNFFCYYFFKEDIFNSFDKDSINMSYESLLRYKGLTYYTKSNKYKPVISNIRWHVENDDEMEMLYLSTFSTRPFSLKEHSNIDNKKMNSIMQNMSTDIINYTSKSAKEYVGILKSGKYSY